MKTPRSYADFDALLQGRCKHSRKLACNTYAERFPTGEIAIKFYATYILTFYPDGRVRMYHGSWKTVTTKQRLNRYLPVGFSVFSRRGTWYLYVSHVKFDSDMYLTAKGRIRWRLIPPLGREYMISVPDCVLAALAAERVST